jgi:hypothetical protein
MKSSWVSLPWQPSAEALFHRMRVEAAAVGDNWLGMEHLLLAAVESNELNLSAKFATLTSDKVRAEVLATYDRPRGPVLTPWSQTPRLKAALMRAVERANAGIRPVTCADLWHGLVSDPGPTCMKILADLGVEVEKLRVTLC